MTDVGMELFTVEFLTWIRLNGPKVCPKPSLVPVI